MAGLDVSSISVSKQLLKANLNLWRRKGGTVTIEQFTQQTFGGYISHVMGRKPHAN